MDLYGVVSLPLGAWRELDDLKKTNMAIEAIGYIGRANYLTHSYWYRATYIEPRVFVVFQHPA